MAGSLVCLVISDFALVSIHRLHIHVYLIFGVDAIFALYKVANHVLSICRSQGS